MIRPHRRDKTVMVEKNVFKIAKRIWISNKGSKGKYHRNLWELLLTIVIQIQINYDWCNNIGKFKVGDRVERNWKARVFLKSICREELKGVFIVREIKWKDENWEGVDELTGTIEQGTSVFWIKKSKKKIVEPTYID